MPEFELDQESISRAKSLSSQLLEDLRSFSMEAASDEPRGDLFSESRYAEQAEGTPISDVVVTVKQIATEFAMARRWDGEIICVKLDDGELSPISMNELFGPLDWIYLWERYYPFPPHRLLRRAWPREEQLTVVDVSKAEAAVQGGLSRFLSYRFAGMKRWAERLHRSKRSSSAEVSPGGGLQVKVSCHTAGLRIHVSPAYFITWVYFGSPTTPVTGHLLPGRYVFAGDGPMLPQRRRDQAVFSIPPTYHPRLTRF